MKKRLHLLVASDHLRLDLLEPLRNTSVRMACRKLWAYLLGKDRAYYQVASSETVQGRMDINTLLPNLEKALNQLERTSHKKIAGSVLEVELGPMLARVGLLEIESEMATRSSAVDLNTYAHAWVKQTWGLDPEDYVIKISPSKGGSRYVLVCVSHILIQQISQWCSVKGIQFIDCNPALVTHLSQVPVQATKVLMVFTEHAVDTNGGRIAQLVVMDNSGPLSISRIWTDTADISHLDAQITHTVRRLCAQHRFRQEPAIQWTKWPLSVDSKNLGGTT